MGDLRLRSWMEAAGWRQGRFVQQKDLPTLIGIYPNAGITEDIYLIVASQSCDIANAGEPIVEFSIAREIKSVDGNLTHNKHPRKLHIEAKVDENGTINSLALEILAHEKICLSKSKLPEDLTPEPYILLELNILQGYIAWLAGRYQRPALPTEFDRRFDAVWSKGKRKKFSETGSEHILGIYVEIDPDAELEQDKNYSVNLLIIIPEDISESQLKNVEKIANEYAKKMSDAGMDVFGPEIEKETRISIATWKRYKRFILDDLSYKNNHPLPPEVEIT